ncbi:MULTISPECIES: serine/threonine protein kinase [Rhodococcus]|nr:MULTISPECIES: serine/threonine protein kinase [Rhodococcus]
MSSPQPPRPWDTDPQHTQPIYSQPGYEPEHPAPPAPNVPPPPTYVTPHPMYLPPPPQPPRSLAWMWVLLVALTLGLLGIIGYIWVWPMIVNDAANQAGDGTHTVVITSPAPQVPGPAPAQGGGSEVVPSYSTRCASVFPSTEFPSSAVGSNVTSCEFSEEVRFEYVSQPQRGGTVTVNATSPVTGQTYTMSCSGSKVVTCTGGNNAVVYVF